MLESPFSTSIHFDVQFRVHTAVSLSLQIYNDNIALSLSARSLYKLQSVCWQDPVNIGVIVGTDAAGDGGGQFVGEVRACALLAVHLPESIRVLRYSNLSCVFQPHPCLGECSLNSSTLRVTKNVTNV